LQTALLNLAINAAHAMPDGGALSLAARPGSDEEGDWVVLSVADTGTGMAPATLARATDPFFSTKGLDGSGLGLSMVKGFAEQSRGSLHISSQPGLGTTAEIRLPPVAVPAAAPALRRAPKATGRILLVDDAPDVVITTGAFLAKAGFRVSRASNGKEALALLADGERFDVLLTDFAMPGMNGVELVGKSRRIQPDLPALIVTGYADVTGQSALPDGVMVLQKPVSRPDLIQAIECVAFAMAKAP